MNPIKKLILASMVFSAVVVNNAFAGARLLITAKEQFNIIPKGIIHVGASAGEEANFYKSLNVKKVIWIEADPSTFKRLVANVNPDNVSIIAENFAASNKDGTAKFFRTNNSYSSSLLALKEHKIIHPDVLPNDEITVTTKRLDSYFLSSEAKASDYDVMVLDIQGAELLALEGAVNTLKNIDCIVTEINFAELYEGGVRV